MTPEQAKELSNKSDHEVAPVDVITVDSIEKRQSSENNKDPEQEKEESQEPVSQNDIEFDFEKGASPPDSGRLGANLE